MSRSKPEPPTLPRVAALHMGKIRREHGRRTLTQMAHFFELGKHGDETAGDWEYGKVKCDESRRAKWIAWLRDELHLTRAEVDKIWEAFVADWQWGLLTDTEWESSPQHFQVSGRFNDAQTSSPAQQLGLVSPPVAQVYPPVPGERKSSRLLWLIRALLLSLVLVLALLFMRSILSHPSSLIQQRYQQFGGSSVLGLPVGNEQEAEDGSGRVQYFEKGLIFLSRDNKTFVVYERFYRKLQSVPHLNLGYPTSDEVSVAPGASVQYFQRGAIVSIPFPMPKVVVVYGAYETWVSTGGATGRLGLPTDEQGKTPDDIGTFQHFEHGSVYWTREGIWMVYEPIRTEWQRRGWEKHSGNYPCGLGYPTSDQMQGQNGEVRQQFQYGTIYVSKNGVIAVQPPCNP